MTYDLAFQEYVAARTRDLRGRIARRSAASLWAEALLVAVSPAVVVLALGVAL